MAKEKKSPKQLITDGLSYVKERWNVPAPGEYTSLKEFLAYCLGSMGISGFTFICGETIGFASNYFCGSIMQIKLMDFTIISFIALAIRYLTLYVESISMTIFENLGHIPKNKARTAAIAYILCTVIGAGCYFVPSAPFDGLIMGLPGIVGNLLVVMGVGGLFNWFMRAKLCSRYGRYKPFMVIYGIPVTLLTILITFIPSSLPYSTKIVLLHFLFTLRARFSLLYSDNVAVIVQLVSPSMVERQKYYSIGGIFLGFFRSIFRIIFPIMIGLTGGYFAVKSYRVFIPILAVVSMAMGLFMIKVKERTGTVTENNQPKIEFGKSTKSLLKNKLFWIIKISATFNLWSGLADGVINYILIYQMRMSWVTGILSIFGITSVVGNVLTPILVKKFEKRTCILIMRAVWLGVTAIYFIAMNHQSIAIFCLLMFIRAAISAACNNITNFIGADVLDYHQWKTGERADNMQTVFDWFTTPVATALGLISPWLLSKYGYTSDWDVLFDPAIFTPIMNIWIALTCIGLAISTLPYLFYSLTRKQHEQCIKEIGEYEEMIKNGEIPEGSELTPELVGAKAKEIEA